MELIYKGAEANIYIGEYLGRKCVIKERVKKNYRIPELDKELREYRTRREARILYRLLLNKVLVPTVFDVDLKNYTITLEYIEGCKVCEYLDRYPEKAFEIGREIGKILAKIHYLNIVHNDYTTANMIITTDNKIYVIDWGMAYDSNKTDDKAYDILVFKKSIKSRHYTIYETLWKGFLEGYSEYNLSKEVLSMAEKLEKMGRYFVRE